MGRPSQGREGATSGKFVTKSETSGKFVIRSATSGKFVTKSETSGTFVTRSATSGKFVIQEVEHLESLLQNDDDGGSSKAPVQCRMQMGKRW